MMASFLGQDSVPLSPTRHAMALRDASNPSARSSAGYYVTFLANPGGQGDSVDVINGRGHSVGYSQTASGEEAVLWSPTDLRQCSMTRPAEASAMRSPSTTRGKAWGNPWRGAVS
jgi:hypothetical protein